MGTQYTYNNDTVTSGATVNNLTGSTIAYYGYVDEDPYLRVLSCNAAGTLKDIVIGSGGSLVTLNAKTVVSNLIISGNSDNTLVSMFSAGPVISGLTVRGHGAKIFLGGVKVYDVDIRTTNRVTLQDSWAAAEIVGGYIESTTLGMSRGTIKNVTVGPNTYVNLYGSAGTDLSIGAHFVSGRAESGAQIKVWSSGGSVASTTFNSANLYMFGAVTDTVGVNRGRAKDLIFENKALFENGGSSFDTKKIHSGGTATNLTFRDSAYMHARNGAWVSHAVLSGQSTRIVMSGGAIVKDVTLSESAYVIVSSGAVLNTVTIGSDCSVNVYAGGGTVSAGGTATDVTVQSGGVLKFTGGTWKNNWDLWRAHNQFASGVTVQSGGTVSLANYAMLMDATAVAGAKITRPSNIIGIGGENTNIAKGVFTNAPGADFQVVGGTATGMDLTINTAAQSSFVVLSGLTVSGATITSGGSLFQWDGVTVNDVDVYGVSGTKQAVISMWNASGANVRISSGGNLSIESTGAVLNGVSVFHSGASLNMKGGTIDGLVMSGGTMWTAQNANKKYIYNIDVTNDNNGAARTGNVDIGILNISSGTYISGGSMHDRAQLNLRYGVVEDVYFGANTWNNIYVGGTISGGTAGMGADFRMGYGNANMLIDGMLFQGNAKVHLRDSRATVKNVVMSGNQNCQIDVSAGVVSSATLWAGSLNISGGTVTSGSGAIILGSAIVSDTLVRSTGKILQSGGTMTNTSICAGGSNLYIYDAFAADGETVVSNLTMVGVGSEGSNLSSGCAWGSMYGGRISGGEVRRAALIVSGGTIADLNIGEYSWITVSNATATGCTVSNGGVIRARVAETVFNDLTLTDSGTNFEFSAGTANNVTLLNGASMWMSGGTIANNVTVASGASMIVSGSNTKVNNLTAASGAIITLTLKNTDPNTAVFDSLANVAELTITGYNRGSAYTIAETGNTELRVKDSYLGFTTYTKAGESYFNPVYAGRMYTVGEDGTTYKVEQVTVSTSILTTEAAGLATSGAELSTLTSGAIVNGSDKAMVWQDVEMAAESSLAFVTSNANLDGDAWISLNRTKMDAKATIYGAEGDYTGTIRYLLHGAGTIGNFAAGATSGGTVGNVELYSNNNTYNLTYMGGMGNVTGHVSAFIDGGNTIVKDFYAGALANYAKTGSRTSVGNISLTVARTNADGVSTVNGNLYGASAVKAGTIDTSVVGFTPLHTVGDVSVTLKGTATKSDFCCFAGGYATGTDSAKLAAVYTVDSVTVSIENGSWGEAHGGRGIFGGAMASDNIKSGAEAAGVYAMVGDVNMTITGGTMGNVYGGGWAQKNARSEVGDVNITVKGGTITGDIYARGQLDGDVVNSAEVIFTGGTDFACGVYGYSYVGAQNPSAAALSFSDYTGTFSGKLGGFAGIAMEGNSWMTLSTAAADVDNGAWIFEFEDRDLGLDGQAALTWSTADFTDDTITLNIVSTRSEGWTLVSGADASKYNTAEGKFLVAIDDGEAVALTFDATTGKTDAIAEGDYAGWGFSVENSVLKFKKLA